MMISILIIIIIVIHIIIAITIPTTLIVLLESLVMITLAVFSLLVIGSVTATPHIVTSVPSNTSILILSLPFFVMLFLYGANLYYYVIQPRRFFGAMLPITTHIITMFALGSFCPPLFKGHGCLQKKKKQGSGRRQHRCLQKTSIRSSSCGSFMFCTLGKLRGSFCLQMGWGLRPPQTPRFLKGRRCLKLPHFQYFHCFS